MKKIALVLMAILVVSSVALSADMAKQGQWGIQTSLGIAPPAFGVGSSGSGIPVQSAGFKFMASDNMAIRVALGFTSFSPGGSGSSSSGLGIGAGFEYHMTPVGGVSPFLGAQLSYASGGTYNYSASVSGTPSTIGITGVYGGEYFFSSNFSLAGEIGIGFTSMSSGVSGASSASTFGTNGVADATFTWYLN